MIRERPVRPPVLRPSPRPVLCSSGLGRSILRVWKYEERRKQLVASGSTCGDGLGRQYGRY
jgi:hypothetical protein